MEYIQKDFSGGLNTIVGDTKIAENQYFWGINARPRYGKVSPVKKHIELTNAPSGVKQGITTLGNFLIIFVAGKAYYRQDGTTYWILIPNFSMSTTISQYFSQVVPSSTFNFTRKLPADGDITAPMLITADTKVSGTPAGVIVQDGETQPYLISFDSTNGIITSRVTKNYNDWTTDDREYVPIGRQMMFLNGILFIVSPDKKKVYRSITGRPLDFMINVDSNGDKQESEVNGGADSMSFAMDFDDITCLATVNIPDSFAYGTRKNTRILVLDYINTLFNEPLVRVSAQINSGIINQYSFVDLIGDYALINPNTVISFDAVQVLKFKGKNSIFSLPLSRYTKDVKQTRSCAITFDNYAIFNIDTTLGNIMAIYDQLRENWVSFDITNVIEVKQFTILDNGDTEKLFCITWFDEVFEMFSSTTEVYLTQVRTRSHIVDDTATEHKSEYFRALFDASSTTGDYTVFEYVDGVKSAKVPQPINGGLAGVDYPVEPPITPNNLSVVDNPAFNLKDGLIGKKIWFIVQWNQNADLIEYTYKSQEFKKLSSSKQSAKTLRDSYGTNS